MTPLSLSEKIKERYKRIKSFHSESNSAASRRAAIAAAAVIVFGFLLGHELLSAPEETATRPGAYHAKSSFAYSRNPLPSPRSPFDDFHERREAMSGPAPSPPAASQPDEQPAAPNHDGLRLVGVMHGDDSGGMAIISNGSKQISLSVGESKEDFTLVAISGNSATINDGTAEFEIYLPHPIIGVSK